ncbi:MAG: hypothetical protein U0350_21400 [Caldilineaceae bacterium]
MYTWPELIHLWEREQLTTEQVIGQLLQHGAAQQTLIEALQRRLERGEPPHPAPEVRRPTK